MTVKFHVLGPVTVAERTESLNIGGTKQRTVLAMLVSRAGQSLTADVLAQAVYGDDLPTRSRRLIQTYVSTLRSVVGDTIAKSGGGWSLVVDRGDVDLFRFEDLYHAAMGLGPDDASAMLSEALSMWRGDPYCDVEAHGALDGEITRLVELHTSMLQARIDADLDLGRHNAVIGELETLVVEHPYQEHFRAQHMLALYRAGRQSDALRSFSGMRQQLVDELGVDPSVELQDLERRILEHDGSLERQSEPPRQGRARAEVLSSVPIPATALVGRGVELARIQAMLSERRLVTLTGVGGCGKTRLAIEVARRMQSELEHGAYFADLSIVASDEDVVSAVVEALRLYVGGGDPLVRILEFLADKQALLVLDNCEHIIDGCAAFAEAVLGQRGDWRVLATSREVLGVAGEQVYGVPRMLTDDDEAVALFAARASDLTPDFVVDDSNRATVRELCERLDGMPLAIELAAARAAVMSPAELLDRIDDRFRILSGGRRRGRNRHRTMEATSTGATTC